jgi:tetratricopeptide (TPR) repeat protein
VFQTVRWRGSGPIPIGADGAEAVPTPSRGALVELAWESPSRVRIAPVDDTAMAGQLTPETPNWRWDGVNGITVDMELLARRDARRLPLHAGMDLGLAVVVATLLVFVIQAQLVMSLWTASAANLQTSEPSPTPEYIARLLEQDLDGADEGYDERVERLEHDKTNQSFYLPAGNDGPTSRSGGGRAMGDEPQRVASELSEPEPPVEADPAPLPELDGQPDPLDLSDATGSTPELKAPEEAADTDFFEAPPEVEKFIGWGFKDWFEVEDARPEQKAKWQEQLELARVRLRIDPNDPYALNTVGLYAYLAENHELSRASYRRMMELYPNTPTAYNNYALVLKREGEYVEEEALYRRALEINPSDTHVLNNLAVCLAHQARFDEALRVMDRLDTISPEDSYADLHRAKIYAAMGRDRKALRYLERALEEVPKLDTLHHIEFRQDLRLDPVFYGLKRDRRFEQILRDAYGDEAEYVLTSGGSTSSGGPRG